MAEKEVFDKNHCRTIIGHMGSITERGGLGETFSQELFILFVRYTISQGITKIGTVGQLNMPNAKKLGSFLECLDIAKAKKSLYDILTEGRASLPEVYSDYEITGGTLKEYEITDEKVKKFEGVIKKVRSLYTTKQKGDKKK